VRRRRRGKIVGANRQRYHLKVMGDSCARVRVRVLAHHPSDALAKRELPMPLDSHPASPIEPVSYGDRGLHSNWGEHIVTVVATSLAMLIVAVIAVLMGMA
jgi:hypothetical protein